MSPVELRERVERAVLSYIDEIAWTRHKYIEEAQRESTRIVAEQLASMEMEEGIS